VFTEEHLGDEMRTTVAMAERPSGVIDIDRAVRAGRRRRILIRGAGAGGVAAVGLAVALVAGTVLGGPDRGPARERVGTSPATPAGATPVEGIDPFTRYLRLGWVPDRFTDSAYATDPREASASATDPDNDYIWQGVKVTLLPVGGEFVPPQRDLAAPGAPPPTVTGLEAVTLSGGRPAQWVTYSDPHHPEAYLRWEYAAGTWVQVRVVDETSADVRADALRVAENVAVSTEEQLALPAGFENLPDGLAYAGVSVHGGGTPDWGATLAVAGAGADDRLTVFATPHTQRQAGDKGYNQPNTTVDGVPAFAHHDPGRYYLQVYGVSGLDIEIEVTDAVAREFGDRGGRSVFQRLTLTGDVPAA
jgi:hypothetical protein